MKKALVSIISLALVVVFAGSVSAHRATQYPASTQVYRVTYVQVADSERRLWSERTVFLNIRSAQRRLDRVLARPGVRKGWIEAAVWHRFAE